MTVSRLWLCGGTEEVKKEAGHRVHCVRTGAPWRLVPSRWLVHFLRLSELWSGCRIKIYCCEIKISVNVRPDVCPRTTSLFMPISSDGLCSLPPPFSLLLTRIDEDEISMWKRKHKRKKKKKKNVLYIKSKWICGWLLQHAIDWPHTEAQNKEIKGGVRGGRTNCQCALHVVACCVLWPAGPQRQESPFNLNTYHHDNNLVTLSEANLFISRFFFSLLLSLSPSPHSSSGSDSLTLLSCVSWITHSQLVVSSLSSVRPSVKCCSV